MPAPHHRIPVAVLGATGAVGQRLVRLLDGHPWFEVQALTASERSAGRPYRDAAHWLQPTPMPDAVADMEVRPSTAPLDPRLVLSALDAEIAGGVESALAAAGHFVVSNAKSHRMDEDVPLVVPEVNAAAITMARSSSHHPGAIVTNPNCSTIGLVLALKPLLDGFGLRRVSVVTMQAVSGAGFPGVASYEVLDNVVPFIAGEEEKIESESRKILGRDDLVLSAQCNRVPVLDGHLLCVSVELQADASETDLIRAWESFRGDAETAALPSAPSRPIHYLREPDAPQPHRHRDLEGGMAASVGRLRQCGVLDYKFVTLSHNTVRGAAGGALLVAELAVSRGMVASSPAA